MDLLGDRYELGATLGAGGMARVVQAHDRVLDRAVAVKLLRDDIATDPSVRERFLREARTAAKFNHPNAVAVYDTGQDGRQPWIVMELVRGEDLSRRLATTGPLEEADAISVADAVLAALGAAHRNGMVHRDVKPGNIMLLDDGGVKLADFGIAKSVQDATAGMTATGQIIGTAKYLSPEQVEGRPATAASDVYAMGVVLYEMLVGSAPYTGDSAIAIALAHTRDPVPDVRQPRPEVSPGVAAVIERAMAKDPADRYADAEEMRRALAGDSVPAATAAPTAVLAADTPTRVLVGDERPTAPSRGDSRGGLWALLALAALLLLGGLFFANQPGDDAPARERPGDAATDEPAEQTDAPDDEEQPADDEEQPQEPEPTEAEPPPTQPPDPTEEAPAIPVPTDLPELTSFLEANPDRFGPRQEDLRKGLEKVQDSNDDKQAEEAAKLSESVVAWADAGELDAELAAVALTLLAPLAAASEEDGHGEGKGKDKGRNGDKGKGN